MPAHESYPNQRLSLSSNYFHQVHEVVTEWLLKHFEAAFRKDLLEDDPRLLNNQFVGLRCQIFINIEFSALWSHLFKLQVDLVKIYFLSLFTKEHLGEHDKLLVLVEQGRRDRVEVNLFEPLQVDNRDLRRLFLHLQEGPVDSYEVLMGGELARYRPVDLHQDEGKFLSQMGLLEFQQVDQSLREVFFGHIMN